MHDADARRLYVDVAEPLAERAAISDQRHRVGTRSSPFRAQAPTSAARSIGEAEAQLEQELRSGYRVVVAFENRGEAERARYNLNRVDARFLDDRSLADPLAAEAEPSERAERSCCSPRRRSPTASSRPS